MSAKINSLQAFSGLFGVLVLMLMGCAQTSVPTPINPNQLDAKGGTIRSSDEKASLNIPSQTLSGAVVFSLTPSNQTIKAPTDKVLVSGTMYALGSIPNTTLSKPATLSLKYDPTLVESLGQKLDVSSQAAANTLEVVRLVNNAWEAVSGSSADTNNNTVQAPITEMGIYALLAPDGSKPVWRLEVRGGIGAVDQDIIDTTPLRDAFNRNFVYLSLTRNGQVPTSPIALQVSGPNGFNGTIAYPADQAWGIYTLSTRQTGQFSLRFSADSQDLVGTVDIATTPTMPLPTISARVVSGRVETSWPAVEGAQSYEVRLYSNTLAVLQGIQTKNLNANLTIPSNLSGQTVAVMVLAYGWDNGLDRGQAYPVVLEKVNMSAALTILTGNPTPPPNPGGEANLTNLTPSTLNLAAATGRSTRGTVNFTNSGSAQLTYTASVSGSGFRITDGASGSLYNYSGSAQITVEGTCGSTTTPLSGTLTINSNDPDTPSSTVQLRLECLQSLTATQRVFRSGHNSQISALTASPNGNQIASRDSRRIILWDSSTGRVARVISTPTSGCCSSEGGPIAYSSDSTRLAAITNNSSLVRVFNTTTGEEQLAISGLSFVGLAWNLAGTQIATINSSNQVTIYNAMSGSSIVQYSVSTPNFYSYWNLLGFNGDGTRILLTSVYAVRAIDAITGTQVSTYDIPYNNYNIISGIALLPGNNQIVAIAYNSTTSQHRFEIRTATTGQLVRFFGSYTPPNSTTSVGFVASPDGSNAALSEFSQPSGSKNVYVWNITNGTLTRTISVSSPDNANVASLAWVGNSNLMLGYSNGLIRALSASTGAVQNVLGYHTGLVRSLTFNGANNQILSGSDGGSTATLAWTNFINDTTTQRLYENTSNILASRWYSTDTRIAAVTSTQSGTVLLRSYNAVSGAQLGSISLPGASTTSGYLFSPDGNKLAYSNVGGYSNPTAYTIVNSPDGTNSVSLTDTALGSSTNPNWTLGWSSDSTRVLGVASDYSSGTTLAIWNASTGSRISSLRLQPNSTNSSSFSCNSVVFSSDGRRVACAASSSSHLVFVFDTNNGNQIGFFSRVGNCCSSNLRLAFDPTGSRLLMLYQNALEVITVTGETLVSISLNNTNTQSTSLAWSPNGRFIALGDYQGSLYIWELQ